MSIGSFTLIKNEGNWIAGHLSAWLPHLDQMVFADGDSNDGTWEILNHFKTSHPDGHKIVLYRDDPKDLKDDYVRASNAAMRRLDTDFAFFLHPDMIPARVPDMNRIRNSPAVAMSCRMRSFAGEPDGQLYEIEGRGDRWKNIYRLRNPDFGAHYHGHYGAGNEDVYFSAITGDSYEHHGSNVHWYPYAVEDSGLEILHFSDVRTKERRLDRMMKCLANQNRPAEGIKAIAESHPRVTLKDGNGFKFVPAKYPAEFLAAQSLYKKESECPA